MKEEGAFAELLQGIWGRFQLGLQGMRLPDGMVSSLLMENMKV